MAQLLIIFCILATAMFAVAVMQLLAMETSSVAMVGYVLLALAVGLVNLMVADGI